MHDEIFLVGINYLQKEGTLYSFTCCGTVKQWRVYIRNSGTIRFQVWRKDSVTGNYILRGENVYTYAPGNTRFNLRNSFNIKDQITKRHISDF